MNPSKNEFLNFTHDKKYLHITNIKNDLVSIQLTELDRFKPEHTTRSIVLEHQELIYVLEPLLKYSEHTKTHI